MKWLAGKVKNPFYRQEMASSAYLNRRSSLVVVQPEFVLGRQTYSLSSHAVLERYESYKGSAIKRGT